MLATVHYIQEASSLNLNEWHELPGNVWIQPENLWYVLKNL